MGVAARRRAVKRMLPHPPLARGGGDLPGAPTFPDGTQYVVLISTN